MNSNQGQGSHLFLVRFWREEAGQAGEAREVQDRREWSGRIQHVLSGEARTFHDWPMLVDLLLEMAETETMAAKAPVTDAREAIK